MPAAFIEPASAISSWVVPASHMVRHGKTRQSKDEGLSQSCRCSLDTAPDLMDIRRSHHCVVIGVAFVGLCD